MSTLNYNYAYIFVRLLVFFVWGHEPILAAFRNFIYFSGLKRASLSTSWKACKLIKFELISFVWLLIKFCFVQLFYIIKTLVM